MGIDLSGTAPTDPSQPKGILEMIQEGISLSGIADAIVGGFTGLIDGLIQMVLGEYEGPYGKFIDGQEAINERFDLLGSSGYCPTVMSSNYRLGPGRTRALPFDTVIGPSQGAELVQVTRQHPGSGSAMRTEWAIRLDRKGLWQANANFNHNGDPLINSYAELVVLRPDLTVYSVTSLPQARQQSSGAAPMHGAPVSLFKMFVVPDEGYYVQVRWRWWELFGYRTVRGGAIYSQFAVTQWSDEVAGDPHDDPDGTIDDDSPEDP